MDDWVLAREAIGGPDFKKSQLCLLHIIYDIYIYSQHYFAQLEQANRHFEESDKTLQERILKVEAQKIQLEEVRFQIVHPSKM